MAGYWLLVTGRLLLVMHHIHDFGRKIELTRQSEELLKFLDKRSMETKTLALAQVKQEPGKE